MEAPFGPPDGASQEFFRFYNFINSHFGRVFPVRLFYEADEHNLRNYLLEEHSALGPSYLEWICKLHSDILQELSNRSVEESTAVIGLLQ